MSGIYTNGLGAAVLPLTGNETIAADTNSISGINPASEAISVSQLLNGGTGGQNLGNLSGNVAINWAAGNLFYGTLVGNITLLAPTNPQDGQRVKIKLTQDGTGSRIITYATGAYLGTGNVTLSTAASAVDVLNALYSSQLSKSLVTLEKALAAITG